MEVFCINDDLLVIVFIVFISVVDGWGIGIFYVLFWSLFVFFILMLYDYIGVVLNLE